MTDSTCKTGKDGSKFWYNDKGELHRENDLPAVEWTDGTKSWYRNGKLHRDNGPAVEYADGSKAWYLNNERHREDGPAREYSDGHKEWWYEDEQVDCTDNETFLRLVKLKVFW